MELVGAKAELRVQTQHAVEEERKSMVRGELRAEFMLSKNPALLNF
jgi:hypothetical protein